ncbi:MAG: DUF3445 domain-containing protein [Bdellovibrionales bacterium]|nr:DUF3445 domain-containing protein [Bdellovibrionales bacterium]
MRFRKRFGLFAFLACAFLSLTGASEFCINHVRPESEVPPPKATVGFDLNHVQATVTKRNGEKSLYEPILSSDVEFLREEIVYGEAAGPQKNMRIAKGSDQFHFNAEAKKIFELRKKLVSRYPEKVVGVMKGQKGAVLAAAREQFAVILDEFPKKYSEIFRREGDTLVNLLTGDRLALSEFSRMDANTALVRLGEFVPEDVIFMKKFGDEYRLIGGNLAFPTQWSIDTFLGSTIKEIHAELTGSKEFVAGFSKMINDVLDRSIGAPMQAVCRNNWFLRTDPRYPLPNYMTVNYPDVANITRKNYRSSVFVRTERQSLRGLPQSKTVVFGIQPMVFPIGSFMEERGLAEKLLKGIETKFLPEAVKGDVTSKVAQFIREDLGKAPGRVETKVLSVKQENASTYVIAIDKPPGTKLVPGEAVKVTLETPTGKETRTLSLANSPNADHFEFAVRDTGSAFKNAFKAAGPGTKVELELLRTSLKFRTDKPAVMIAGGIGITPFRSYLQFAKEKNLEMQMFLLYGNRDAIAFDKEIGHVAEGLRNVLVNHVLSQAGDEWLGTRGRIDKRFLESAVPTFPNDAIYYIVATPQMTDDVTEALIDLGIPESRIRSEAFPASTGEAKGGNAVLDPEKIPDCQTVCFCRKVTAGQIRNEVAQGATTLSEIQSLTGAGTACGGCAKNILNLMTCALEKAGKL